MGPSVKRRFADECGGCDDYPRDLASATLVTDPVLAPVLLASKQARYRRSRALLRMCVRILHCMRKDVHFMSRWCRFSDSREEYCDLQPLELVKFAIEQLIVCIAIIKGREALEESKDAKMLEENVEKGVYTKHICTRTI